MVTERQIVTVNFWHSLRLPVCRIVHVFTYSLKYSLDFENVSLILVRFYSLISLQICDSRIVEVPIQFNTWKTPIIAILDMTVSVPFAYIAFSALTPLVGRQEEHSVCKNWVMRCWCGYLSGARCRLFAYGPADATASQNSLVWFKSRLMLAFSYWLTQVVLEKTPFNGCVCVVCVCMTTVLSPWLSNCSV